MLHSIRSLALAVTVLSACGSEPTAPTAPTGQPGRAAPVLVPPPSLERARTLPLADESVGWCDLVIHRRDGGPARHYPLRAPSPQAGAAGGQVRPIGRIVFARWEKGSRRAVAEASCVVELDGRSARQLRMAVAQDLDMALGRGIASGESSLRLFEDLEGSVWSGEDVDCMLITLFGVITEMDCQGVSCGPMATLRRAGEEGPVADIFFDCDNGCTVDMDYLLYDCGGGGGDVEEGSGDSGGGSSGSPNWDGDSNLRCHNYTQSPNLCNLRAPKPQERDQVRAFLDQLPEPYRSALRNIVDDVTTKPSRFQVWTNYLSMPNNGYLHGDVRAFSDHSGDLSHLYIGNLGGVLQWYDMGEGALNNLCHEAVHAQHVHEEHAAQFDAWVATCKSGLPT